MENLSLKSREYLRILLGDSIQMNFTDASQAILELKAVGYVQGVITVELTPEGRVKAKQVKHEMENGK